MTGLILDPNNPQQSPAPDAGLVRSDAGLLVPKDAVQRKQVVWTKDFWKKMRRLAHAAMEEKFSIVMVCEECKAVLQIDEEWAKEWGGLHIVCACTEREVRG